MCLADKNVPIKASKFGIIGLIRWHTESANLNLKWYAYSVRWSAMVRSYVTELHLTEELIPSSQRPGNSYIRDGEISAKQLLNMCSRVNGPNVNM